MKVSDLDLGWLPLLPYFDVYYFLCTSAASHDHLRKTGPHSKNMALMEYKGDEMTAGSPGTHPLSRVACVCRAQQASAAGVP